MSIGFVIINLITILINWFPQFNFITFCIQDVKKLAIIISFYFIKYGHTLFFKSSAKASRFSTR